MGLYDYYGAEHGIQLKAGPCEMHTYTIGDMVSSLPDGVYVGYEGLAIVYRGRLKLTFSSGNLFNKWGGSLSEEDILDIDNPIVQAIGAIDET